MMMNPYTPGAGFKPRFLAGRERILAEADAVLEGLARGYQSRPVVFYGLRGVGKTVLLNEIEERAENLEVHCKYIEASEDRHFTKRIVAAMRQFLNEMSATEAAASFMRRCLAMIHSFVLTYDPKDESVSVGLSDSNRLSTGIYADDLSEIIVTLGGAAKKAKSSVCFLIDEVQYLETEEARGLMQGLHRCMQLQLPVMLYCAGLPKILKTLGETTSYAERLFRFEQVDSLSFEEARAAVREPAKEFRVDYEEAAVHKIISITKGYPYFIQEICSVIWEKVVPNSVVMREDVDAAEGEFFHRLDSGFFSMRYNRCTDMEKRFMNVMARSGHLPCAISEIAQGMGGNRTVHSISPLRAQLISKGMIYATAHGTLDFTVPQFDSFLMRNGETVEGKGR